MIPTIKKLGFCYLINIRTFEVEKNTLKTMTIAICLKATDVNTRQIGSNYQIEVPIGENTLCVNFTPEALDAFTKDVATLMKAEMSRNKVAPRGE